MRVKFRSWFLSIAAIFLIVTGGAKIFSVLMETGVLGARDPLLPFLSVRQIMFLAALLEGGVGYLILRNSRADWVPWLLLWLAALFVVYRLCLWMIGFSGGCNCLGQLFGWLPGSELWADRAVKLGLFGMMAGSLGLLYSKGHPQECATIQCQSDVKSNWIILALCCAVGPLTQGRGQEEGASTIPPYEVRGAVTEEFLRGQTNEIARNFVCRVDGTRWNIELTLASEIQVDTMMMGTNAVLMKRAADREFVSSDGTNFYATSSHVEIPPHLIPAEISQRPTVTGSAQTGPGHVPFGQSQVILAIWYTYASAQYLSTRQSSEIVPPHIILFQDVTRADHMASARWELLDSPPFLPRMIQTSNYFFLSSAPENRALQKSSFPHTNAHFQVLGTEKFQDLEIPSRVQVDYHFPRLRRAGVEHRATKRISIETHEVSALREPLVTRPPLSGNIQVYDMNFWFSNPPVQVSVASSNAWPRDNVVQAKYRVRVEQDARSAWNPWITTVLVVVGFGPPLALWWIARNKRLMKVQPRKE